jgi:PAS domain-containing protein
VLTKGGSERLLAFHNTVLRDEDGTIIGTLSSGEDITERKILRSVQSGVVVVDRQSRVIIEANPAALRMIGAASKRSSVESATPFYAHPSAATVRSPTRGRISTTASVFC